MAQIDVEWAMDVHRNVAKFGQVRYALMRSMLDLTRTIETEGGSNDITPDLDHMDEACQEAIAHLDHLTGHVLSDRGDDFNARLKEMSVPCRAQLADMRSEVERRLRPMLTKPHAERRAALIALQDHIEGTVLPAVQETIMMCAGTTFDDSAAGSRTTNAAISRIERIIGSIQMISINAAIEAARVGDAGRGFSIIAAEIRSLSMESQVALTEIRSQL